MKLMQRCFVAGMAIVAGVAIGQDYPSKSVRVILPYTAGGSSDLIARIIGSKLSDFTGQQFLVDNRTGAGGTIGAAIAAASRADGYTLLLGANSLFAIVPHLYPSLPYDPIAAFIPVSLIAISPLALTSIPSLPANDLKSFVALAKSRPGGIRFASAGIGVTSHLAMELLMSMTGANLVHVPYKGGALVVQSLLSGETEVGFNDVITALPHWKTGKLRVLGVSTDKRASPMPDVPTLSEAGLSGFDAHTSFGLFAVAGTPKNIVAKLVRECVRAANSPDVKERLASQGMEVVGGTDEEYAAYSKQEIAKWSKVFRERNIKLQ